jgi:hypothetical protein
MIEDAERQFLEIGNALRNLLEEEPNSFATLTEAPEIGRRRAYYFVEIAKAFQPHPHLHEKLQKVGWTKSALLAKHADAPNLEELLQLAEEVTTHELSAFLKQGPTGLGGGVLMFKFDAPALARVTKALKANGAYEAPAGLRKKEIALLKALSIDLPGNGEESS